MRILVTALVVSATVVLAGCASTPDKPRLAQEKTFANGGHPLHFAGKYFVDKKEVILSVNGDPVLRGHFPPFTPTLNMKAKYNGMDVSSHCYFGSVLSDQGGAVGLVAGLIQSEKSKSDDECDIAINGKAAEKLYF